MWDYISERVKTEAEYILQTGATVRSCAAYFNVSKSTVHKDVTERLKDIDEYLWRGVRAVLDKNLSERHIRGGIATKNKYLCKELCRNSSSSLHGSDTHSDSYNNCRCRQTPPSCCCNSFACSKKDSMSCSVCGKDNSNKD